MDQDQNQPQATPKQQVVERVRAAMNVLVTVRSNPSVDELSAAIGLTLMLNKLGKHATAVFSGQIPSTLEFLKPEETLETTTDSLRDFIVSLDKSKADKLRYKVEENVVKIFITPYRTSITQDDLEFTQGDFNVDVVLALGVTTREELDQAITAHGRILHDATVITASAGQRDSSLGAINWQEPGASSLSEMLVSVSEAFQGGIIDAQMATAFLTGIVSETDRFSNPKTTPKVMTMAAQLMAAGANQQLIANELQHIEEVPLDRPVDLKPEEAVAETAPDGSLSISHDEDHQDDKDQPEAPEQPPAGPTEPPRNDDGGRSFLPPLPPSEASESFEPLLTAPNPDQQPSQPATQQSDEPKDIFAPVDNPPTPDDNQIHIDGDGNVVRPDRPLQPKHKSIQPLGGPEQPDTGELEQQPSDQEPEQPTPPIEPQVDDPLAGLSDILQQNNQFDGTTAISDVKGTEPGEPLPETPAVTPEDNPTLPAPEPQQPEPATEPAVPAFTFPTPDAPMPAAPVPPPPAAPAPPEPSVPEIPDETTLLEIEKTVNSPHLVDPNVPVTGGAGVVDNARNAVQDAFSQAGYDPTRPEPRTDLNAQPLGMPSFEPAPQPVLNGIDPSAPAPAAPDDGQSPPPPLPPPMMPLQ